MVISDYGGTMAERYYENGQPQCQQRCVVGELGRAKVCCCEYLAGHSGSHERIPTMRLAGVKEFELPWYENFVQ
jgi:hypothetical protein